MVSDVDELRILDARGCITLEAMGFPEHLDAEQRAVVERHIRSCSICAQQQTDLIKAKERLRRARPRIPVPREVKVLSGQLAMLRPSDRERIQGTASRGHTMPPRPSRPVPRLVPWYHSRQFWVIISIGMGTSLVLVLLALLLIR
jgi:hypothetical protein